ncbi:hypothetical protein C8R27_1571 [Nitrosomonas ureae]|uniref:hypothetical protein n=1 Tax=Nitrosomonas ureae TaxID=44577 RepID=UPI000D75B290|nr:hypothetical protein [Nitrosomonas ureae]PXX07015.1 hypothetical protein C8R27_1571 [Nitrosomonas ureae]
MTDYAKVESKLISGGTYQICFKSGATVILEDAELWASFGGTKPWKWYFVRSGEEISYTSHISEGIQRPLDEVIDAIFRLK